MSFSYCGLKRKYLTLCGIFSITVFLQLALLIEIYLFSNNLSAIGAKTFWVGRRGLIISSMFELVFIILTLPLIVSFLLPIHYTSEKKDLLTILPYSGKMIWKELMVTILFLLFLVLPVMFPIGYLYTWGVPVSTLLSLILTLFFTMLLLTSIHLFFFSIFKNSTMSTGATFLVTITLIGGVILMNPIIEWVSQPENVIHVTLLLNPLVAIASAINLDVLRTDPLYYLSKISVYQFRYPRPVQFWFFCGSLSFAIFILRRRLSEIV